jgi:uncharacterized membrane protein (TIGR02234 family)
MSGRRLKLITILAVVIGAVLGLAAATQTWYTITIKASAGHFTPVVVSGSTAAPALTALSLAGLALALALAIAGRVARYVIGVIGVLLGVCVVIASVGNPAHTAGVRGAISTATGIAGEKSVTALIGHASATIWPVAALVGGIIVGLGALAAVLTGSLWPGGSRRYDAVRFEEAEDGASARPRHTSGPRPGDAQIDDWDELTRGDDPTER